MSMRLFFKHQDIENIKYFWKETIMENKLQTLAGCSIFEQHVLDYCYTIGSYKRRVYEYDVWFDFSSYVFTDIGDDSSYIYKWNKNLE